MVRDSGLNHVYGAGAPVMCELDVLLPLYNKWVPHFGIIDDTITSHVHEDVTWTNSGVLTAFEAKQGSAAYEARAKSDKPFLYVPYGVCAMNSVFQRSGTTANHFPQFQNRLLTSEGVYNCDNITALAPLGVYRPVSFMFRPGSVLTYDWATKTVLALRINQDTFDGVNVGSFDRVFASDTRYDARHHGFRNGAMKKTVANAPKALAFFDIGGGDEEEGSEEAPPPDVPSASKNGGAGDKQKSSDF
jgi:hypothetical protein